MMSKWHVREIKKGIYGDLSKIQEELDEAVDSEEQDQKLMLLFELSDIIGAVGGVAEKLGFSLDELVKFSKLRKKVFLSEQDENKQREDYFNGSDFIEALIKKAAG